LAPTGGGRPDVPLLPLAIGSCLVILGIARFGVRRRTRS
jgi:hypothetical protein